MTDATPRLRGDLILVPSGAGGTEECLVKDPVTARFFRLRRVEYAIARRLDGATALEAIAAKAAAELGVDLPRERIERFVARLDSLGLLEGAEGSGELARRQRLATAERSPLRRALYIKLRTVDPGRFFEALSPRISFFFTRQFVIAAVVVSIAGAAVAGALWREYVDQIGRLLTTGGVVAFFAVAFAVTVLHEFAHGFTCAHFGGSVREMGVVFIYLMPAFYCNVTDAWLFREKGKRLWVSFAGVFFQAFLWAAAAILWRILDPETLASDACVIVMAASGITMLFSLNPLIKLDGYYLLSDYLEMPNLRQRAFAHIGRRLRLHPDPRGGAAEPSARERRIYWLYGLVAGAYSFFLIAFIIVKLAEIVVARFHGAGLIALAAALILVFTGSLERWTMWVHDIISEGRILSMKRRKIALIAGCIVVAALVLVFGRWELKIAGRFTLLPASRAAIRAETGGIVRRISCDEGDTVRAGEIIAELDDSGLRAELAGTEAEIAKWRAELDLLEKGPIDEEIDRLRTAVERARTSVAFAEKEYDRISELYRRNLVASPEYEKAEEALSLDRKDLERAERDLAVLLAGSRPEKIRAARAEVDRLAARRDFLVQEVARSEIRSPIDGVVATHRLGDRIREHLDAGEEICEIVDCRTMLLEMPVSEKDIVDVLQDQRVKLKARALPGTVFWGSVVTVPPVAIDRQNKTVLVVTCEVANPGCVLKPGMTGTAKIYCGERRIISLLTRRIVRFVRVEFWWW